MNLFLLYTFISLIKFKLIYAQADGHFWWKVLTEETAATTTTYSPPEVTTIKKEIDVVCCECVPFYLCVNGTIDTSGAGIIDIRSGVSNVKPDPVYNVESCPDYLDVCCEPPEIDPSCATKPTEPEKLPDDTPCTCVVWEFCPRELIVSNGLGNTTLYLDNEDAVSHSNCNHALHVCCALHLLEHALTSNLTSNVTSASVLPNNTYSELDCECVEPHLCLENGDINVYGIGAIDARSNFGSDNHDKPKNAETRVCPYDSSLVCCGDKLASTTLQTTTVLPTTTTKNPDKSDCGLRHSSGIRVRNFHFFLFIINLNAV